MKRIFKLANSNILAIPQTISGLRLWVTASDPLGNGSNPADNTALSFLKDKSRFGSVTITQSTGANQARFRTNVYNGLPTIRTNSNNFYTVSGMQNFSTQFSFFLVATPSATTPGYYFGTTNATGRYPAFITKYTNGSVNNYEYYAQTDRQILSVTKTGLNLCEAVQTDSTKLVTRFNGTQINDVVPTTTFNGNTISTLLASAANADMPSVDFCEIIIYNKALSTTDATIIRNYLQTKWGI